MRCAPPASREDISSSAAPRRLPCDPMTVLTAVLSTDWTPLSWLYTCFYVRKVKDGPHQYGSRYSLILVCVPAADTTKDART